MSFQERKDLLDKCFPELEKLPLEDEDRGEKGHKDWGERLIEKTDAEVVISRNETVIRIVKEYTGAEIEKHELHEPGQFSGTRVRKKVRREEGWRPLIPECSRNKTAEYEDIIEETG